MAKADQNNSLTCVRALSLVNSLLFATKGQGGLECLFPTRRASSSRGVLYLNKIELLNSPSGGLEITRITKFITDLKYDCTPKGTLDKRTRREKQ